MEINEGIAGVERLRAHVALRRVSDESKEAESELCEAPRPLRRQLPPAEPFPVDALPDVLREAALAIHAITRAPIAIGAQSVLAVATLAVQAHADIELPTRAVRPLSCNFITIADSGDRKTSADDLALKSIRDREKLLTLDYERERNDHANRLEAWDKQRAQILSDKGRYPTAAQKRAALDELGESPLPPLLPMLTCPEPTFEGLTKLLRDGQPSIGLFSSEGGQFIGGHAMSAENRLKTAAAFSSVWDGTPVNRVRQGDGSFVLHGRRVAVHLLVQPGVGARLFSDATLDDQGTLSRLLAAYPETTAGTRFWKEPEDADFSRISSFSGLITKILETPARTGDKRNELVPRVLRLSLAARRLWIQFVDHIEAQMGAGGDLRPVRAFASKAPEHAARIASVFQLISDLAAQDLSGKHMAAGITLVQHYITEALRIHAAGLDDPDLVLASKLLEWLTADWLKKEPDGYVSLPDIYQLGPSAIRDKGTAGRIVAILVDHGYLRHHDGPMKVAGETRRDVWVIVKEVG
ncbi:MAG: YfjI family protein [Candidatus Binatus sp.]